MRIVFNSKLPDAPCTVFYQNAFSQLAEFSFHDFEHYEEYDLAMFMTYKPDLEQLLKVKQRYPNLFTAIVDPRGSWVKPYLQYADLLIVDSLEMRDFWSYYDIPILEYSEYPDVKRVVRNQPRIDGKLIVGYHGNLIHLESMRDTVSPALEKLGQSMSIELWAMYNYKQQGLWKYGLPDIKVRHIPWSMENYTTYMAAVHIGLVPCFIPERRPRWLKQFNIFKKRDRFNKSEDDYILRFKMPSNPGRIIVWSLLDVPVIADIFPSAMQAIEDGKSGLLAYSAGGWYRAIKRYVEDYDLRAECVENLFNTTNQRYSVAVQNQKLIFFLESFLSRQIDKEW